MPIDDRKQKIMMAIVSLYANGGEPVGSNLLSHYFNLSVSSATLRNEMAALTKLGMLEQPHTSAGRVPTPKGYRYYVDHLLDRPATLPLEQKQKIDGIVNALDYDPEKLARGAAVQLADLLGYAMVATTPLAKDLYIAHYEVIQVGRYSAAVLAVTVAGGVLTRVAKVDFELDANDAQRLAATLNAHLRFVAEADVSSQLIRSMVDSLAEAGPRCWPILSAALTLLAEAGKPSVYFEGQQYLLQWPELENGMRHLLQLVADREQMEALLQPNTEGTLVIFGDELQEQPIPGLCIVSRHYHAGGGLKGVIAALGPTRMRFSEVIPTIEYFSELMGKAVSAAGSDARPPR
ncbi:heat-inducible transcriptional repressor HrcA [Ruminococcaceae bacterium OttesenSCG-928-I18]|nr:heat-inducible transcriptional repressor HrcA [Ruminococcaceae bacterium OttesenSCG-928-I18]